MSTYDKMYNSIDILNAYSWNTYIRLSDESIKQIQFWIDNINCINVRNLFMQPSCDKMVHSDRSGHGFGGYCVESKHGVAHGAWNSEESCRCSTCKELVAVLRVLLSLSQELAGKRVKWFTDNKNVVSIVNKGSMKEDLQNIALDVYKFCLINGILLDIKRIPRSQNEKADFISNLKDANDWRVSYQIFEHLNSLWGPFEVDWFASDSNHKMKLFYSRYWNVKCFGIDAFTGIWSDKIGWFCPPIY